MTSMRFLLPRLAVALLLIGPFVLRMRSDRWEVYPAVLQPVGASVLRLHQAQLEFTQLDAQVIDAHGREHPIDLSQLLRPLRSYQWDSIINSRFGLGTRKSWTAQLGTWSITSTRGIQSQRNEARTRQWLLSRIAEQGVPHPVTLRLRRFTITFDVHQRTRSQPRLATSYDVDLAG